MTLRRRTFSTVVIAAALTACGGGSDSVAPAPPPAPAPAPTPPPAVVLPPLVGDKPVRISADTPFSINCNGGALGGVEYRNAEVEPYAAVSPSNAANLVAVWQQDRLATGLANGVVTATTLDGGATWARTAVPFTRCAGGNSANGGNYERATDPWVTFAPNGNAFQMVLATEGGSLAPGSVSVMLDLRSGATQPDDRQRDRGAAQRDAGQPVHPARRSCGRSNNRHAQRIAIKRQGRQLERPDSRGRYARHRRP